MDFGSHLAAFWDPKCVEKSNENLEAFLEGKKGVKMLRPQSVKTSGGPGVLVTGGGGPRLRSK